MPLIFSPGHKLLLVGDSITDCGRRGTHAPLGDGYVHYLALWLTAAFPAHHLQVVNRGTSGDTVRDVALRWQRDVLDEQPDWLFVLIGVNDVWRHVEGRLDDAVPLEEYEARYRALLEQTRRATNAQLLLLEPFLIEPRATDSFRARLTGYQSVVRQLATEFSGRHVPLQASFDRAMEGLAPTVWAEDRVHPTPAGHMRIAQELLHLCGAHAL